MIRTYTLDCSLPKAEADALNQESGRLYTLTLLWHYRVYRRTGRWLSPSQAEKLGDFLGGPTTLHAHSRDAAQQGFWACQTAKACKARGLPHHYPRHRKRFRTTIWKDTGIRVRAGRLLLSRARGLSPVCLPLPAPLLSLPPSAFLEARLVWDRASRRYDWHLVVEEGATPAPPPGTRVAAVDLGEIHPAALTDGEEAVVVTARALRSTKQYTAKRLSQIQARASHQQPGSRRARRLKRRKSRFLAQQKRRVRDIEHKVSRAVVAWAEARGVGTLALGDVRDIADGKRLKSKEQQKIGCWSHGRLRAFIRYKAEASGITVAGLVDERHTSQTCPVCQTRHKPKGRIYRCPVCGFRGHRDIVGAANLLSRHLYGEVGKIEPPAPKYRLPYDVRVRRSRLDTAQVARSSEREAARL